MSNGPKPHDCIMNYTDEWGDNYKLRFYKARYQMGGMAILAECCEDDGFWEPYADVTTYIFAPKGDNCAYLDTNNAGHLIQKMVDAGYVELTGRTAQSGWCTYPEGHFNEKWLAELEEL